MAVGRRLVAAFGRERFRVELQRPFWRHDRARNRWLAGLAERLGVPCVATGDVHMHDRIPGGAPGRAVRRAAAAGRSRRPSRERRGNGTAYLAAPAEMAARFGEHRTRSRRASRLAERLGFDLTRDLGYRYPGSEDPGADRALAEICRARLEHRYAGEPEHAEARPAPGGGARADPPSCELSGFLLLHFDILELAREVAAEVRGPDSARGAAAARDGGAARASARSSAT